MVIFIELIGWIATFFRSVGMLCKSANVVKYFVSAGNFFWMVNGLLTHNIPLIASNAICLVIMLVEIIKNKVKKEKNP